jgi:hypothetical protein
MSLPVQSVSISELDFSEIKKSLISYFKTSDSEFKDWDYAGSNLNTLIDVLAHNTHYNAMLSHLAINETFIDSAQLRQNVVSAAKLIGYTPRSVISSKATINIQIQLFDSTPEEYVIARGTSFSGNLSNTQTGKNYNFTNLEDIKCKKVPQTNTYVAENVVLHQGYIETVNMQINNLLTKNEYIIDNTEIDTNTLKVTVYPEKSSQYLEVYSKFADVAGINENSLIYFLYENYESKYVVSFGNNIFGKRPDNLNILQLQYLVSDGDKANKITQFTYTDFLDTSKVSNIQTETVNISSGGAAREQINSIKYNAPIQYIAQNRAVTADDYKALIYAQYPNTGTISVWGGEDNIPAQYGKVFICIKPNSTEDETVPLQDKLEILNFLKGKKVMSIIPEIVDPEYIDIVIDVLFKYNPNQTNLATTEVERAVKEKIVSFNDDYLQSFDGIFRHSMLSRVVDTSLPCVLNSLIRVFVSKKITFDANRPKEIILKYGTSLQIDDDRVVINSSGFYKDGILHYFGDRADVNDANRRILTLYYYDNATSQRVVVNNYAGEVDMHNGIAKILPIIVDDTSTDSNPNNTTQTVYLDLIPISNDIISQRNQLIRINTNRMYVYGEVDAVSVAGSNKSVDYRTFTRDRM